MPTYSLTGPDGKNYSIDGPEGATREQVIAKIKERQGNIPPTQKNQDPDITKAAMPLMAPVLVAARGIANPVDTIKDLGEGVKNIPRDIASRMAKDRASIVGDLTEAVEKPGLWNTPKNIGSAALTLGGSVMNPINSAVENTYGRLANKATGGSVSPEVASLLPELAIPFNMGRGAVKTLSKEVSGEQAKDIAAMSKHGAGEIPKDPEAAQRLMMGAAKSAQGNAIQSATGASPATSAYQATRTAVDAVSRGVAKLNGMASNLYQRAEIPASRIAYNDEEGSKSIVSAALAAQKDGVKLGPELSSFVENLSPKEALTQAKLAGKARDLEGKQAGLADKPEIHGLQEQVIKLRGELHDLMKEGVPEDAAMPQKRLAINAKNIELASARLDNAKKALDRAQGAAQRQKGILGLQKEAAAFGTVPKKTITVQDLIAMDRRINGLKHGADAAERAHYQNIQDSIQKQIVEHAPNVARDYMQAKGNYRVLMQTLGGSTAKSLGIDKAFADAAHASMSGDPKLATSAYRNALTSLRGIEDKVDSKEQLDLLRDILPAEQYGKIVADVINLHTKDFSPDKIEKFAPLFKNIVSASGYKGEQPNLAYSELRRIATLMKQTTGAGKLAPGDIRNAKNAYQRIVNGLKFALAGAHGNLGSAFAISHGAEAIEGGLPAIESRIKGLRGYIKPGTELKTVPGEAIGAALTGYGVEKDK